MFSVSLSLSLSLSLSPLNLHFSFSYRKELTANCREKDSQLYCLRCFDNMESSICAACRYMYNIQYPHHCQSTETLTSSFHLLLLKSFSLYRRPIESRVIHALGKTWHPEVCDPIRDIKFNSPLSNVQYVLQHFVCSHCEKPFEGRRHYEKKGKAYCERDYKAVRNIECGPMIYIYCISSIKSVDYALASPSNFQMFQWQLRSVPVCCIVICCDNLCQNFYAQ